MSQVTSPSGRYTLSVSSDGHWNSTGIVRLAGTKKSIATIKRDYSSFPHLWIENYAGPDGIEHDFLVCGEDYQGQTVCELDTGTKRNFLPTAAKDGHGFCWTEMRFDLASKIIIVNGCIWACPFEYRCYDFSDPFDLREIEIVDDVSDIGYMDGDDPRWPEITSDIDGIVTVQSFQSEPSEDDESEAAEVIRGLPVAISTYVREGFELRCISELVTAAEKATRAASATGQLAYEEATKSWQATDPLYLTFRGFADSLEKNKDHYDSCGVTYKGWCPHWQGNERRWCRRIYGAQRGTDGVLRNETATTIDLEWATETGPIKVTVFPLKNKNKSFDTFFDHTVEGMRDAFAFAAVHAGKDKP